MWSWGNDYYSSIEFGSAIDGGRGWDVLTVVNDKGTSGNVSLSSTGDICFIMWEHALDKTVRGVTVRSDGVLLEDPWTVSNVINKGFGPASCSIADRIDSVWIENDSYNTELYYLQDSTFEHPSLVRLRAWIGSLEADNFVGGNESKAELILSLIHI